MICQNCAISISPFFTQKIDVGHPGSAFYSSAGMLPIAETLVLKYIACKYQKHSV